MRFDAVCGVDLDTALPAKLVARIRNKPFCYDAHEYFTEVPELVDRPGIQKVWKGIERTIITPQTKAYTVSQSIADIFYNVYGVHFKVIRNVAVLDYTSHEIIEKKNRIIYAGAVNKGRGLEELIQCMNEVSYDLIICGDGDMTDSLVQMVTNLGLEHKVSFTGYLPPDQLNAEIKESKIGYLMLSFQGLSYYHSLANKFFDYMHAEIPQLCIDFPEYRNINATHEVAVLSQLNPEDISINLNRLINDRELYQTLEDNCRKAKEVYNWQKESEKLVDFYQDLLLS